MPPTFRDDDSGIDNLLVGYDDSPAKDVDGRAHPEMSDLAATIYDYADRVEHVIVRLIDMSERCEL